MQIVVTGRAYDLSGNFVDRDSLVRMCREVDIHILDTMTYRADALVASDDAIRKRTRRMAPRKPPVPARRVITVSRVSSEARAH